MKTLSCIGFFFVFCIASKAQIAMSEVLQTKLDGKSNFQEIKNTVLAHYEGELKKLSFNDSIQRKTIMRQLKMWNREFWINEYYTDENGEVKPQSKVIMDALEIRKREEKESNNRAQIEGWVSNGPISTNFGLLYGEGVGRVDRLAFHPTNPNIIFAGSPYGGLFKTEDGGANWYPISAFVASLGVSGIAINPGNPNIIYVLTGDGNKLGMGGCFPGEACNNYTAKSDGVYKTVDGGNTWKKLPDFYTQIGSKDYFGRNIIMHPTNPNILYAATSLGLFKTTNGGNTWAIKTDTTNIWDVVFKPGSPDSLYCVGDSFLLKTNSSGNFINLNVPDLINAERISIAVTPANPNKVALFAGNTSQNSCIGVFVSVNSGSSFIKYASSSSGHDNLFHNFIDLNVTLAQQNFNNTIAISPTNENLILVGGLCIWSSDNGGMDWEQETCYWAAGDVLHEYIHPDQHHLIYHPNGKLYVSNDGGVYVSEDDGDDWEFIETGLSITQFYHFEWENDEGNPWGGAQDNGILERLNGYEYTLYSGGDGYDVMTDHPWRASDGDSDDIYFSANEKINKDGIAAGGIIDISVPDNIQFFANLAMKSDKEDYIYAGYQNSTFRSPNAGGDWYPIVDSIPGNWCIAAGSNNPYRLYTSGNNSKHGFGRLFRNDHYSMLSINLTDSLQTAGYNISQKITDIEVDELDDSIVYITCGGLIDTSKVYKSFNAGASWSNVSYNLPNVPIFCIKKDELDGLYVGTSLGVYYKQTDNEYWEPYYNELPAVPVTQIEIEGQFVHASTFGRGLWTTKKYTTCLSDLSLTGQSVGKKYFETSNNLSSNQQIINSPGTSIIYSAGNKITLTNGMKVEAGAKFHGVSQPCGSEIEDP